MSGLDVNFSIERETNYHCGRRITIGWRFQIDVSGPGTTAALAANELRRVADDLDDLAKNPPLGAEQPKET